MNKLVNKLTSMIEVKKIIALWVVGIYCMLAVRGSISSEQFSTVAVMIVSFYFGQSTVKGAINNQEQS